MQHGREGHVRLIGKRVPQRQGAVSRELGDEPFRQRLETVILFGFGCQFRRTGADGDDGTIGRTPRLAGGKGSPPPSSTGSTGGSSSGRTYPRSIRRSPSLSMLTKTPARPISAGS